MNARGIIGGVLVADRNSVCWDDAETEELDLLYAEESRLLDLVIETAGISIFSLTKDQKRAIDDKAAANVSKVVLAARRDAREFAGEPA